MESKIALTHRLYREGRWDDATIARDEERQRLRTEGMNRRESNEASWKWMAEHFPPLTDQEVRWRPSAEFLAMAEFPIDHPVVEAKGELPFPKVWEFLCYWFARQIQIDADDMVGVIAVERYTEEARRRAGPALTPVAAMDKLEAVLQRLDADPSADRRLWDELDGFRSLAVEMLGWRSSRDAGLAPSAAYEKDPKSSSNDMKEKPEAVLIGPAGQC